MLTALIISYPCCSLLFICPIPTLPVLSPATSFAEISPEVTLDYRMRNGYILFDMKQSFYFKPAWIKFCNSVHTVLKRLFRLVYVPQHKTHHFHQVKANSIHAVSIFSKRVGVHSLEIQCSFNFALFNDNTSFHIFWQGTFSDYIFDFSL